MNVASAPDLTVFCSGAVAILEFKKWGSHYGANEKSGGSTSGVTDQGARRRAATPAGKLKVKTGLPLVNILIFNILQFVVFCVFRFFLASTDIHDIQ